MAAKKYRIDINHAYCKACGICVKFCPKHVLELRYQVLYAVNEDECIGCQSCELRCPDYAIEIMERGEDE